MHLESLRAYCLEKPGTTEGTPFDNDTLVFKVMGKMFALISISQPDTVNLKCDPERAEELRAEWEEIQAGYHMSKKHWNTVQLHGRLTDSFLRELIDHSYTLVASALKRSEKEELARLKG
jgi:predicted DNA-binding protein (MmcQ/YjbR family)